MVEIGDVIELDSDSINVTGVAPSGNVLIDGLGIGDVGAVVLRDRKHLAEDGLLIVVMGLDHDLGTVVSGPDIISRGFVYVRESDELVEGAREAALRAIEAFGPIDATDWNRLKNDVRESVQRYIFDAIKRNPMILPIIVEI
jgi:ribonuclease J